MALKLWELYFFPDGVSRSVVKEGKVENEGADKEA